MRVNETSLTGCRSDRITHTLNRQVGVPIARSCLSLQQMRPKADRTMGQQAQLCLPTSKQDKTENRKQQVTRQENTRSPHACMHVTCTMIKCMQVYGASWERTPHAASTMNAVSALQLSGSYRRVAFQISTAFVEFDAEGCGPVGYRPPNLTCTHSRSTTHSHRVLQLCFVVAKHKHSSFQVSAPKFQSLQLQGVIFAPN